MTQRRSPATSRRRLGPELRRYRDQAELTIDAVAEKLNCSPSKISRIETGHTNPAPRDVLELLTVYGVFGKVVEELLQMARDARQKGWWQRHPHTTVLTGKYVGLEAGAKRIRAYEQSAVPGLLQTYHYSQTLMRTARPDITDPEEIDRRVRVRMQRQSLLIQDDPINLWVVLDEAVLRRPVGGPGIMRAQLLQLLEAVEMPNVTIQVLPFAHGAHAGMDGTFAILDFPEMDDSDVVFAENATGGLFLEGVDDLTKYSWIFRSIHTAALNPDESAEMIANLAKEPSWKTGPRDSPST